MKDEIVIDGVTYVKKQEQETRTEEKESANEESINKLENVLLGLLGTISELKEKG